LILRPGVRSDLPGAPLPVRGAQRALEYLSARIARQCADDVDRARALAVSQPLPGESDDLRPGRRLATIAVAAPYQRRFSAARHSSRRAFRARPGRAVTRGQFPMISHHIHAALAHERASTFLTEAQAHRRARQARPGRPRAGTSPARRAPLGLLARWLRPSWRRLPAQRPRPVAEGTPAVLRDGSAVLIRQVRGSDAPLLADGFARLSARSRQMRFLSVKHSL